MQPAYRRQRVRIPSVPPPDCLSPVPTWPRALITSDRGFDPRPPLFPLDGLRPGGTRSGARSRIRPLRFRGRTSRVGEWASLFVSILLSYPFPSWGLFRAAVLLPLRERAPSQEKRGGATGKGPDGV